MNLNLSDELNDIIERAAWTAVQTFCAVFAASDLSSAKSAIIAGVSAALSVIKNGARRHLAR